MDMVNHSRTPNCGIFPYRDKLDNNHSYVQLVALRNIEPNEQLTVTYGDLCNMHYVQKYGFTLFDQEQESHNIVQGAYYFEDYQQIVYEEQALKQELRELKKIGYHPEVIFGMNLFPNKFEQQLLQRLRLSFLTSKTIMDFGGTAKLKEEVDFKSYFD